MSLPYSLLVYTDINEKRANHEYFEEEYNFYSTLKLHKRGHDYDADVYVHRSIEDELELEVAHWLQYATRDEIEDVIFLYAETDDYDQGVLALNISNVDHVAEDLSDKFGHREVA